MLVISMFTFRIIKLKKKILLSEIKKVVEFTVELTKHFFLKRNITILLMTKSLQEANNISRSYQEYEFS